MFSRADFDGDGIADLLVGAENGNGRDNATGDFAGQVYLIYGRPQASFGDAATLSQRADVIFYGVDPAGFVGTSVAGGDIDGDGYADVIIGSLASDASGTRAGKIYVFYGGPRRPTQQRVDVSAADLTLSGGPNELAGFRVVAGDVDGDGLADIAVSAPSAAGPAGSRPEAGSVYVVFGGPRGQLSTRHSLPADSDLTLYGGRAGDHFGWGLALGDLDGDGLKEVLVGAIDSDGPTFDREATGQVYVVWGSPRAQMTGVRDMATLDGATIFYGIDETDLAGYSIAAGDVDGDGRDDLIIGAPTSEGRNNQTGSLVGEAYVVFGNTRAQLSANHDLAQAAGMTIWGGHTDDHLGLAVETADINGDGYQDIVLAAPAWDGYQGSKQDSGAVYVLLGRDRAQLPTAVDLVSDNVDVLLQGPEVFGGAGTAIGVGDLDGDGQDDLAIASPFARGQDGSSALNGQVAVLISSSLIHGSAVVTADRFTVKQSEFDPATGQLTLIVADSANDLAIKPQMDLFAFDGVSVTQLTSTPYDEAQQQAHGGAAVWVGWDGHDTEIYESINGSVVQLTDNAVLDLSPQTNGQWVVWQQWDGNDFEIMLYDGQTVHQLTNNDTDDVSPQIDGDQIVWQGWDGNDAEIYLYRNGQVIQLTNNDYNDISPRISNGQVVWMGFVDNNWEIFLYDGVNVHRITTNTTDDGSPDIFDGEITWMGFDGQHWQIFHFLNGTVTQITHDTVDDVAPRISSGGIVWQSGADNAAEIVMYANGVVQQLTSNQTPDVLPAIDGNHVVWQSTSGPNLTSEIMLYDGQHVVALTNDAVDDVAPVVSGNEVIWRRSLINATVTVDGLGPLTYDREHKVFVGTFQVAAAPASLTIRSPLGGTATTPVTTIMAADANVTTTQLSTSDGQDPMVQDRWITWHGWNGVNQQVFLSDSCQTQPITNNLFENTGPRVQHGSVVWQGRDAIPVRVDKPGQGQGGLGFVWVGGDFEIWKSDGVTTQQLTNNDFDDIEPVADGNRVAWRGWDGNDFEVFLNDGVSTTQLTNNAYDDAHVRMSGNHVVWQGWDGHDYEIFLYDGTQVLQLTNNDVDDLSPEIDGNRVVWFAGQPDHYQVWMYDGTQVVQMTNTPFTNVYPQVHGSRVAWQAWDGNDFEIVLFDGTHTIQLTNNDRLDERPRLDDKFVVWQGSDGYDLEIFYYDGLQVHRLTSNTIDDLQPEISNGLVTWESYDGTSYNVSRAALPGRTPDVCPPPQLP